MWATNFPSVQPAVATSIKALYHMKQINLFKRIPHLNAGTTFSPTNLSSAPSILSQVS